MAERDYGELVTRLRALDWPYLRLMEAGTIHGYPVFHGTLSNGGAPRRRILISSGTHGDEPAGPQAALQFWPVDCNHLGVRAILPRC